MVMIQVPFLPSAFPKYMVPGQPDGENEADTSEFLFLNDQLLVMNNRFFKEKR